MSERRREERLEVCLDAVWDGKRGNYIAHVTDLSEGGCYVDTLGDAQVGEILSFKIQTPTGEMAGANRASGSRDSPIRLWSSIRLSR